MSSLKKVLAVVAAVLAVLGILVAFVGLWLSWSLNTPVTESLTQLLTAAERGLVVIDNGLTRVDEGVGVARSAVSTVEETTLSVGETLVETNLAFAVLDRTVGDTLFPPILAARDTAVTLAETAVAFNDALEAANRLPFVELPTLTTELQTVADRLTEARATADEVRAELRAIKEEKVARPVTFITDRTGPLLERLDAAAALIEDTAARIDDAKANIAARRERLPRVIDLLSLAATLVWLWLIAAQAFVLIHAFEYLSGRRINWGRSGGEKTAGNEV